ncbi:MAG: hypothetical protein E7353_10070 [Clostridiales bacterium]|nr:hypothetical protein [Clostridiales bacterium]
MRNLIIACGHYGSTAKVAEILSRRLDGETVIFDQSSGSIPDWTEYNNIILGGNIRMNKPNKNFRRFAKKLKKASAGVKVYAYIVCGFSDKAQGYVDKVKKLLPFAERVDHVGGVLSAENATGFWAGVIVDARNGLLKAGKPLPAIDRKHVEEIARYINSN